MKLSLNIRMVITAIAILCICLFLFDKCNDKPEIVTYNGSDSLKQVIVEQTKIKDSLLIESKKKDTIRVTLIRKYRTTITDTIYKECEPIIKICDSIIIVDSSEISLLKNVIKVDSSIIGEYKERVKKDSLSIDSYKKAIKKHLKRKKWFIDGRCHHFTKETIM